MNCIPPGRKRLIGFPHYVFRSRQSTLKLHLLHLVSAALALFDSVTSLLEDHIFHVLRHPVLGI